MGQSVQLVNISEYTIQIGSNVIPSAYRAATFMTGTANSIDLATLTNVGERDLQRLLAEGKVLVLPASTLS